jgi:hypothetical protein
MPKLTKLHVHVHLLHIIVDLSSVGLRDVVGRLMLGVCGPHDLVQWILDLMLE